VTREGKIKDDSAPTVPLAYIPEAQEIPVKTMFACSRWFARTQKYWHETRFWVKLVSVLREAGSLAWNDELMFRVKCQVSNQKKVIAWRNGTGGCDVMALLGS
jgi:hypothetical protein